MVGRHIRQSVISLGLNKVEGHTIHKKMPDFFSLNDISHMA